MGKKTKILYVITKSNFGGAQKYVYDLAVNMPKDQFEVVVALGGNGILIEKLTRSDIRVIGMEKLEKDINIFKEFSVLIDLIKIFKKEQPDIIHLNSSKIGGLGSLAGRLAGVPKIIFTAHGFAHNEDRPKIVKMILFLLNYFTILWSHKTIIINKREFDQVNKLPFISKKLELIYVGIGETKTLKIEREPGGSLTIGTISELTKNKGLDYVIEAVARLKNRNINFAIIGEGEERERLMTLIEQHGLTDIVQLLGFKENASSYISLFDIFTLTSLKEGLPYSILEAGLVGLPVIASDVGGIGEIIENGKSGILVKPKNVEQIVEALSNLIDHPEKRKSFGENLRKKITEKFSAIKMLEETEKLYLA